MYFGGEIVGISLSVTCLIDAATAADEEAEKQAVEALAHKFLCMVRTDNPNPSETIEDLLAETPSLRLQH